jgi:hypothetical protein
MATAESDDVASRVNRRDVPFARSAWMVFHIVEGQPGPCTGVEAGLRSHYLASAGLPKEQVN